MSNTVIIVGVLRIGASEAGGVCAYVVDVHLSSALSASEALRLVLVVHYCGCAFKFSTVCRHVYAAI